MTLPTWLGRTAADKGKGKRWIPETGATPKWVVCPDLSMSLAAHGLDSTARRMPHAAEESAERVANRSSRSHIPNKVDKQHGRTEVGGKMIRGVKTPSSRGPTRSTVYNKNVSGSDRPEHPLSSFSRMVAEEAPAMAASGGDGIGNAAAARVGGNGGGHRRVASEIVSSSQRWAPALIYNYHRSGLRVSDREGNRSKMMVLEDVVLDLNYIAVTYLQAAAGMLYSDRRRLKSEWKWRWDTKLFPSLAGVWNSNDDGAGTPPSSKACFVRASRGAIIVTYGWSLSPSERGKKSISNLLILVYISASLFMVHWIIVLHTSVRDERRAHR